MEENRHGIIWGILLILLGSFFLVVRMYPNFFGPDFWPFIIIGLGGVFLISALLTRSGGLAIPGCILGGIGGILYYQVISNNWASWSYMWTLIPGFVGVGIILAGLLSRGKPHFDSSGLILMTISAMGFFIFGGAFELKLNMGTYWPLFLIGVGLITLVSALFHKR